MNISSLIDLEDMGLLDIEFSLRTENNIQKFSYHGQVAFQPGRQQNSLDITATYKWSARKVDRFQLPLQENAAEYLANIWPENLQQLQTVLMLGGASDVWVRLENRVMTQYNLYNEHQGELADVGKFTRTV